MKELFEAFDIPSPIEVVRMTRDVDDTQLIPENFTGVWEIRWENGVIHSRGTYINGKQFGPHLCLWENGQVAQIGMYWADKPVGIWTDHYENGETFCEGLMGPNGKEGVWRVNSIHNVRKLVTYENGKEVSEELLPAQ